MPEMNPRDDVIAVLHKHTDWISSESLVDGIQQILNARSEPGIPVQVAYATWSHLVRRGLGLRDCIYTVLRELQHDGRVQRRCNGVLTKWSISCSDEELRRSQYLLAGSVRIRSKARLQVVGGTACDEKRPSLRPLIRLSKPPPDTPGAA